MREKFINLIDSAPCPNPYFCSAQCEYAEMPNCHSARIADHLLANKAMVPPCDVGDTIYTAYWKVKVCHVIAIEIRIDSQGIEDWVITDGGQIRFKDFGKYAFLTREEAEAKWKEDEGE